MVHVGGVWVKVALARVRTSAQIEHIGVGQRVPREVEAFQSGQPGGESVGEVFKGARHGRTAAQIAPAQFQGLHTAQSLQRCLRHCSDAQCEVSVSFVCAPRFPLGPTCRGGGALDVTDVGFQRGQLRFNMVEPKLLDRVEKICTGGA